MISWIKRIFHPLGLILFWSQCRLCGNFLVFPDEAIICRECRTKIKPVHAPLCLRCGKTVGTPTLVCGECLVHPPPYRQHISFSVYENELKEAIILFKYGEIGSLKDFLADCCYQALLSRMNETFDFIIPVPSDAGRKREFRPVPEIAGSLSRRSHISLLAGNLVKARSTPAQVSLSGDRRRKNLKGAFTLKHPGQVKGKKILLIDDVYTTGTTIKTCAESLVKAGAEVWALTLARSI